MYLIYQQLNLNSQFNTSVWTISYISGSIHTQLHGLYTLLQFINISNFCTNKNSIFKKSLLTKLSIQCYLYLLKLLIKNYQCNLYRLQNDYIDSQSYFCKKNIVSTIKSIYIYIDNPPSYMFRFIQISIYHISILFNFYQIYWGYINIKLLNFI